MAVVAAVTALLTPTAALAGSTATSTTSSSTGASGSSTATAPAKSTKTPAKATKTPAAKLAGYVSSDVTFPDRALVIQPPAGATVTASRVKVTENRSQVGGLRVTPIARAQPGDFGEVIAIDRSTGMYAGGGLKAALAGASRLASLRAAGQELSLITFDPAPTLDVPLTDSSATIDSGAASVPKTAVGSDPVTALELALNELALAHVADGAVILISDGVEIAPKLDTAAIATLKATLAARHIALITVGIEDRFASTASLNQLAAAAPGQTVQVTPAGLGAVLTNLQAILTQGDVIRYRSSAARGASVKVSAVAAGTGVLDTRYVARASSPALLGGTAADSTVVAGGLGTPSGAAASSTATGSAAAGSSASTAGSPATAGTSATAGSSASTGSSGAPASSAPAATSGAASAASLQPLASAGSGSAAASGSPSGTGSSAGAGSTAGTHSAASSQDGHGAVTGANSLLSSTPGFAAPVAAPVGTGTQSFWASSRAVVLIAIICGLLIAAAVLFALKRPDQNAVRARVGSYIPSPELVEGPASRRDERRGLLSGFQRGAWWPSFVDAVEVSRNPRSPVDLVRRAAAIAVGLALVLFVATGSILVVLFVLIAWPLVLRWWVYRAAEKQRVKFRDTLPSYLQDIASSIRVGRSVAGAFAAVGDSADEPTSSEFERAATDEALGRPLEECLDGIALRMNSSDMGQVALIAGLSRRSGSNVAEALDRVAEGSRERADVRREMRALTAQAKMSSSVLTGLPAVLLLGLSLISPQYAHPLLHTTLGLVALGVGATLVLIGWKVMGKITNVKDF